MREWNNLPSDITQSESVVSFKHNLNRENIFVPKHFYTGKRYAQILHTPLRTNCSELNYDLFLKNIIDYPLCRWGEVENTYHFFFQCLYCRISRTELFDAVAQYKEIALDLLLTVLWYKWENIWESPKVHNRYQEIHCCAVILRIYKTILVKLDRWLVLFGCNGVSLSLSLSQYTKLKYIHVLSLLLLFLTFLYWYNNHGTWNWLQNLVCIVCLNAYVQLLRYNSINSEYHLYMIFAIFSQLLLYKEKN